MNIQAVAHIQTPFDEKFGIPRQGEFLHHIKGKIHFEKDFQNPHLIRGIEQYSHLWLIWGFSLIEEDHYSPTVRPPRLGGNERMGVFATRSPFRPNHLGMTVVKLEEVTEDEHHHPILVVSGVDMVNHTPIYDIKPYSTEADRIEQADSGMIERIPFEKLQIHWKKGLREKVEDSWAREVEEVLSYDPRPAYQRKKTKSYGMHFGGMNVRFEVDHQIATILSIEK